MKKKIIMLLLTMLTVATPVFATEFTDIEGNFAYSEIQKFNELGYFKNIIDDSESLFNPNEGMTRGDIIVLLLNAFEIEFISDVEVPFADYDELSEINKNYVRTAYSIGLIDGKLINNEVYISFDDYITREEVITILGKFIDLQSDYSLDFLDSESISNWSKPYVSFFYEKGLIQGDDRRYFNPKDDVKRAEGVKIANSFKEFYNLKIDNGYVVKRYIGNGRLGYKNNNYSDSTFTQITDIEFLPSGELIIVDSMANKLRSAYNDNVTDVIGNVFNTNFSGLPVGGYIDGKLEEILLNQPKKVLALNSGVILFNESDSNSIRAYIKENNQVFTLAGDVEAGYVNGKVHDARFNNPMGMAEDSLGNIYIADTLNHVIRKISNEGVVSLFAGNPNEYGNEAGTLLGSKFNEPVDIFIDENDIMYVVDAGNNSIKKIENGTVEIVAGIDTELSKVTETQIGGDKDGSIDEAMFNYPMSIFVSNNIIYVADTYNNKIKKIEDGVVSTIAGTGKNGNIMGEALESSFNTPKAIYVIDDVIYVADTENSMIKIIEEK